MMEKVGGRGRGILMGSTKNGKAVGGRSGHEDKNKAKKEEGNNFSCCLCLAICL